MKNRNGQLALELVTYTVISAIAMAGLYSVIRIGFRETLFLLRKGDAERDARSAFRHIRRTGRTARSCVKQMVAIPPATTPTQTALECQLDLGFPVSGTLTQVRFLHRPGQTLSYERFDTGSGLWQVQATYDGIAEFDICDTTEMQNGTCLILPAQLNNLQAGVTTRSPPNRYFRYRMRAIIPDGQNQLISAHWQSAFFVRNPTVFGASIVFAK